MTAAYLFYSPKFRPLTPAGVIMPNAYVQFYETLTTTPADVYADADLSTPLTNPVESDASGEFPAIYLDPTVTYRAQFYDEDDALIWDIDPLAPPRDYPVGTVLMFFGTSVARDAAYPPALWQVCDGTNGSPDLRDRVPMGCSGTLAPGDTGGGSGITNTSAGGDHAHGGATDDFTLTDAEMPTHSHGVLGAFGPGAVVGRPNIGDSGVYGVSGAAYSSGSPSTSYVQVSTGGSEDLIEPTGDGDPHAHDIALSGTHTHTVDTTPPFLALWFLYRRA